VALFAVTAMLGLALVVGWNARLLHLADAARGQIEAELARQATHDALTGLPNRALFADRLGQALARASRRQATLAVLFLDLDGFKAVNDSLGHAAGDQLLVAVADRMRACLRLEDTVARLGGDEFTILLEGLTDLRGATLVAERITRDLVAPFTLAGHAVVVTSSIGIVLNDLHRGEQRADELLRDADVAMYRAKAAGKARHAVFAAGTDAGAGSRLDHEIDPRGAVPGRPQPRPALGQPPAPPVPLI